MIYLHFLARAFCSMSAEARRSLAGVMSRASDSLLASTDVPINGAQSLWSRLFAWLPSWKPTSETHLEQAEAGVLKAVTSEHRDLYVPIAREAVIRTFVAEPMQQPASPRLPLVMLHGFGAGFLQFYKNLDHLHAERQLLAVDLPGFGRSTRVPFSHNAERAESEMVEHLETWRRVVGVERFILLGHSLGAFLACSYAICYPSRVHHLILVDPWGIPPPPSEEVLKEKIPQHVWRFVAGRLKPFDPIRVAGPWGSDVMLKTRPDLQRNFGDDFMDYVYHCNVQKPTGEEAFYQMQHFYGWAKHPMLPRLGQLLETRVPITLILGQRSWMKSVSGGKCLGEEISRLRPESYVDLHNVPNAGHHVHADQPEAFCEIVNAACAAADSGADRQPRRVEPKDSSSQSPPSSEGTRNS